MSLLFGDFERWALLKEVILVLASQAESKRALDAATEVLVSVNLCSRGAVWLRAVAHVLHAGDSHIKGELIELIDDILINADIREISLCHESLAAILGRACQLSYLASHDKVSCIVAEALLAEKVKAA
jgi:hypothetical protein